MKKWYDIIAVNGEQFLVETADSSREITDVLTLHEEYEVIVSKCVSKTDIPCSQADRTIQGVTIELVALDIADGKTPLTITWLGE